MAPAPTARPATAAAGATTTITASRRLPLRRVQRPDRASDRRGLVAVGQAVASSNKIALVNRGSNAYLVELTYGGRPYLVHVDTGSSDTWLWCGNVNASRCRPDVRPEDKCAGHAEFVGYGSGDICVVEELAAIELGSLVLPRHPVGIAVSGDNVTQDAMTEGLLGLGFSGLSVFNAQHSVLIEHLESFSVTLTKDPNQPGSLLLLNGVDADLIRLDNLTAYEIPIKLKGYWGLGLTALQVGGDTAQPMIPCSTLSYVNGSCEAIIDTGTSFIVMPPPVFEYFQSTYLAPMGCFNKGGEWICSKTVKLPDLTFWFGRYQFTLHQEDYTAPRRGDATVVVKLQAPSRGASADDERWAFGDVFLQHYHTSFDVKGERVVFYCRDGVNCRVNDSAIVPAKIVADGATRLPLPPSPTPRPRSIDRGGKINSTGEQQEPPSSSTTMNLALQVALIVIGATILLLGLFAIYKYRERRRPRRTSQQQQQHFQPTGRTFETIASTGGMGSVGYLPTKTPVLRPSERSSV